MAEKTITKEFNQEAFDKFESPNLSELSLEDLDDMYAMLCYSLAAPELKKEVLNEIKTRIGK